MALKSREILLFLSLSFSRPLSSFLSLWIFVCFFRITRGALYAFNHKALRNIDLIHRNCCFSPADLHHTCRSLSQSLLFLLVHTHVQSKLDFSSIHCHSLSPSFRHPPHRHHLYCFHFRSCFAVSFHHHQHRLPIYLSRKCLSTCSPHSRLKPIFIIITTTRS